MSATDNTCGRRKRTLTQRVAELEAQSVLEKELRTLNLANTSTMMINQSQLTETLRLLSENLHETLEALAKELVDLRDALKQQQPPTKKQRTAPPQ